MKKKILSFITLLCMVISLLPTNVVFAATSGTCGDNLTWKLDDKGTLTISGTGDMTEWVYSNSMPWYQLKSNIKSVVIENGVTSIGNAAFMYSGMSSVDIGNGITFVGENAFEHCNKLASVNIKDVTVWCNINFCSYESNPLYYAKNFILTEN